MAAIVIFHRPVGTWWWRAGMAVFGLLVAFNFLDLAGIIASGKWVGRSVGLQRVAA